YFALPYQEMDKALWAHNVGASASDLASMLNISEEQAKFVFQDIDNKRKTTHYLHAKPYLIDSIPELGL
ncbi:MAG: NAD(+) synthase, partial [Candidatus Thiodiazotropha sp. (ex Lucinoma borealis)]|nr:NAD(+) synthase [Candidatus Thiodiazotropha sp. (ex Lucinoma borealis)]